MRLRVCLNVRTDRLVIPLVSQLVSPLVIQNHYQRRFHPRIRLRFLLLSRQHNLQGCRRLLQRVFHLGHQLVIHQANQVINQAHDLQQCQVHSRRGFRQDDRLEGHPVCLLVSLLHSRHCIRRILLLRHPHALAHFHRYIRQRSQRAGLWCRIVQRESILSFSVEQRRVFLVQLDIFLLADSTFVLRANLASSRILVRLSVHRVLSINTNLLRDRDIASNALEVMLVRKAQL